MKKGTFNKIIKIGNIVLKFSTPHSSIAKEMLNLDSKNIKKYEADIKNVGIKTSKVYFYSSFQDKDLIIQEYIDGLTIQEYLDSDEFSPLDKLKVFKKIVEMYKMSLSDENLCLDWNLNNFILKNDDIYYIDYVPAFYKDQIKSVNSERLKQYQQSLIDTKIQMAGIISYAIVSFFDEEKQELKRVYEEMKKFSCEILKIDFSDVGSSHVYIKKLLILEDYLNSVIGKNQFLYDYNNISMTKTAKRR